MKTGERGTVFIFELKDLEVIEISYTFASRNKPNECAKEYKKEKQNGHLPSDAPCEHSPLTRPE